MDGEEKVIFSSFHEAESSKIETDLDFGLRLNNIENNEYILCTF